MMPSSIFITVYSVGKATFAMLTGYFDDSGTSPTNRVAVVAGCLGSVRQWERFNERWKSLLAYYKISKVHRAELEGFKGEFSEERGWNPDRRQKFLQRVHSIIKSCTYIGVGFAVTKADFEQIIPPDVVKEIGGVYGWCAHNCLIQIEKWSDAHNQQDPIQYIFEAGTHGAGQVGKMLGKLYADPAYRQMLRIKGWSFQGKDLLPLQAADVVAYECYKHCENQILDKGKRPIRKSAEDLFRLHDTDYFWFSGKEHLQLWLDERNRGLEASQPFKGLGRKTE